MINVFDSSNILTESLQYYQPDYKQQRPQKFMEIENQPLFAEETVADLLYAYGKEVKLLDSLDQQPLKPANLIDIDGAEKTYANLGELD